MWFLRYVNGQTDKQTCIHANRSTSPIPTNGEVVMIFWLWIPYPAISWGRSNEKNIYMQRVSVVKIGGIRHCTSNSCILAKR